MLTSSIFCIFGRAIDSKRGEDPDGVPQLGIDVNSIIDASSHIEIQYWRDLECIFCVRNGAGGPKCNRNIE